MTRVMSRQSGMTITGWIFVIAIVLFFALLGVKMVPNYIEHNSISKILEGLKTDRSLVKAGPQEIMKTITRRFDINSIYDFDMSAIKIKKSKEGLNVAVDYEKREKVAGNVEVVMHFHKEVDLKR